MGPVLKYCLSLPQFLSSSYEKGVGQPMILRVGATTLRSSFLTAVVQSENHKQTEVPLHFVAVCSLFPTRDDPTRVVSSANFIVLLMGWVEMS